MDRAPSIHPFERHFVEMGVSSAAKDSISPPAPREAGRTLVRAMSIRIDLLPLLSYDRAMSATVFKYALSISVFFIVLLLENFFPLFVGRKHRLRHGARNLFHAVLNNSVGLLIGIFLFADILVAAQKNPWGLFHLLGLPPGLRLAGIVLLFDLWMYVWHRLNHIVPLLWKLHRMHHSDPEMDVTTAFRFHVGEIVISTFLRLVVLLTLGMSATELLIYETIMLPIVFLHHSNFGLPANIDRVLRAVIVTPRMHWVHHSRRRCETDSNYGAIFSWWDRFFRTFKLRSDPRNIRYGIPKFGNDEWQSIPAMLRTPFASSIPDPQSKAAE